MKAAAREASFNLQGCLETCRQSEALVRLCVDAAGGLSVFEAIGPQLCHCLDHYRSLLEGLTSGTIDYDVRAMDPSMMTDPELFLAALYQVTAELAFLSSHTLHHLALAVEIAAGHGVVLSADL